MNKLQDSWMKVRYVLHAALMILFAIEMHAQASPNRVQASPNRFASGATAQAKGVSYYEIKEAGRSRFKAELYDSHGRKIGTLRINDLTENGVEAEYHSPTTGKLLVDTRGLAEGVVTVGSEVGHFARFVLTEEGWSNPEGREFVATYWESFVLVAAVVADLSEIGALTPSRGDVSVQRDVQEPDPGPGPGSGSGRCNGIEHRGLGVGDQRSFACRNATTAVNVKCWNMFCIGCCNLFERDSYCVFDDFTCAAGRSGTSCSGF